ncbi:DEAD/DEAH box helicase [Duganella rhizosphaerae]|uniref:ligase-associated DNA damage response endonuclease PdeM n=1 Tax=Duganella rhizosphaerae TaxID=2885763 RepID=UPI0030EAE392
MSAPITTVAPVWLAGELVLLLAQKALYWPREKMLVVADIHFGKAASFRALGVPVPGGTTAANTGALDALIGAYDVRQILFLGDFLHAKAAHAAATLATMREWRWRHPQLRLIVVRGNHDAHAGDPPASLGIDMVDEPHALAPFAFCHHPDMLVPAYVLAGHVHPLYRLRLGRESLMLPCFLLGAARAVLPSFGAFTGGHAVAREPGERLFLTTGDAVFEVPA